ncbi:MAG: glycosyltransferase [Patescibacteria group bacterium]
MNNKKVSIIIPARNEEKYIQKAIESLMVQKYELMEIIVVVNGSEDATFEIAKRYADKTLNFPEPMCPAKARNEGVKISEGDIFVFLDADSQLLNGAIKKITEDLKKNTFGTCLGKADKDNFKGKLFFLFKNWIHILRIYKGVIGGVFFCHRDIFLKVNGFNQTKKVAEFQDFIKRATTLGVKYKLFRNCYAAISLRRFEEKGYLKTFLFWIKWKIASFFKKDKKIAEEYFKK